MASSENHTYTLRIKSVPEAAKDSLMSEFQKHGTIIDCNLELEPGTCFLSFASLEEAYKAISACHMKFKLPNGRRPITVELLEKERCYNAMEEKLSKLRKLKNQRNNLRRKLREEKKENKPMSECDSININKLDQQIKDLTTEMSKIIGIGSANSLFNLAELVEQERNKGTHSVPMNDIALKLITLEQATQSITSELLKLTEPK